MATVKITITLPVDEVRTINELVAAGRSPNVSAFIRHAVNIALSDVAGWQTMLNDALDQTGGPLTPSERQWADGLLNSPAPSAAIQKTHPRKNKAA